jgi:hypothetical protein
MPTDHNSPDTTDTAPHAATNAATPDPERHHPVHATGASGPHDEASMRTWVGLPPDAMILIPGFTTPPVRLPDDMWALLVLAVDIVSDTDPDRAGEVALFAGRWVPDQPPPDLYDGDLVVRLPYATGPTGLPGDPATDVELLLAHRGRWQRVGQWHGVDQRWPVLLAPTAAAVMGLHIELTEAAARQEEKLAPPFSPLRWVRGALADLLDAGLVKPGEELVWDRRNLGVRHTARVHIDGTLVLADGRVYANPSGATTALGGNHQNGWNAFRRTSDGRSLGELRAQLRAWRRH